MLKLLFLLFILVPLFEIYLLIEVGSVIGAGTTILLTVLTAVTGAALVRLQGVDALMRAQQAVNQGEPPAQAVFDGACLLVAGALLLTPGFFTDGVGFLLLVPAVRAAMMRRLLSRVAEAHAQAQARAAGAQPGAEGPVTLEGEYKRKD